MGEDLRKGCSFCDKSPRCDKCPIIESLRKMLQLFERRDTVVIIVTRNKSFRGYIYKITEDTVYLSDNMVSEPNVFICIYNIVRFNTMNTITNPNILMQLSEKISTLINSTCNINPCCRIDGIVEVIDRFNKTNSTDLLCFILDTDFNFPMSNANCFTRTQIIKCDTNIVFAIKGNRIFLYPTCGINSLEIRQQSAPVT